MTAPVHVRAESAIHIAQTGSGPDVLLIAGLSDPAEAWQFQLDGLRDRYRLIAYDNRGTGRTPLPTSGRLAIPSMVDDAVAVLDALGVAAAHVAGFSGGSCIAQELALRHPERVSSLVLMGTWARRDAYLSATMNFLDWLVDVAPSDRAMLEAFFLWIYTPRAHGDGTVAAIIEEALSFEHPQSTEAFKAQLASFRGHDSLARLAQVDIPTLVLAGELDMIAPPRYGCEVADAIPGSQFEVLPGEAHQPFQERPAAFNARVDAFWREVSTPATIAGTP